MSLLINKALVIKICVASIVATIFPFVFYNLFAKGEVDLSLQAAAFVGIHVFIGLNVVYLTLKWLSLFNFLAFFLVVWFLVYAVISAYSFKIGYGNAALVFSLFLSVFSLPSILISWFILTKFVD